MDLKSTVPKFDPENDKHWTKEGLPSLEAMILLSGQLKVSREDVERELPGFTRQALRDLMSNDGVKATIQIKAEEEVISLPKFDSKELDEMSYEDLTLLNDEMKILIAEKQQVLASIQSEFQELVLQGDKVIDALTRNRPQNDTIQQIQLYLKNSNRLREVRVSRMQTIVESGLNLKELANSLKAPIDRRRSRK